MNLSLVGYMSNTVLTEKSSSLSITIRANPCTVTDVL